MASHKRLKGVVRSLAESFTSLMNYRDGDYIMGHVVLAAWSTGARELRVDLLTGATDSSELLTPTVMDSVRSYVSGLPDLVSRSNSDPRFISEAELSISVEPTIRRPHGDSGLYESPYTCTVRMTDDHGKVYSHRVDGWWFPERTLPARTGRRWWQVWRRLTSRLSGPA